MTCESTRHELVPYYFGTVDHEARKAIERHLSRCSRCLTEYFAIKAEVETATMTALPSSAARARLRSAVARELRGQEPTRAWAWWERPLAFGIASAAVFAAVIAVQTWVSGTGAPPRGARVVVDAGHVAPTQ